MATTKEIMTGFKKQFLFLFSFPLKIPAILSQQAVSNIDFSQQFFSSFSFFLSFLFYLGKCLSHRTATYNKVHSLIYCWWNRILSVSLFLFWIQIIPIFRMGRRKNSCIYLWQGLDVHIPFFFWASDIPRIGWISAFPADFCPKILFYSFYARLSPGVGWIGVSLSLMSVHN